VVARLGGRCNQLTKGCSGTRCAEALSGTPYVLPSHGGMVNDQAREGEQQCGLGRALVGLNVLSGSLIDGVGGICAVVGTWTDNAQPPSPTTSLSMFGGDGGSPSVLMCPRGALLTGWELRAGALIDSVRPICRWF
jgi:hypothetical protein